jgi:hypothetical protein
LAKSRSAALALSILTPFAVHVVLTFLLVVAMRWRTFVVVSAPLILLFSVAAGFFFLVRPFRRHIILVGLIYFPTMLWCVIYFSLYLFGRIYGSSF